MKTAEYAEERGVFDTKIIIKISVKFPLSVMTAVLCGKIPFLVFFVVFLK